MNSIDSQNHPAVSDENGSGEEAKTPPNIVICSDGTWNQGGAVNPTNVWRTYQLTSTDNQIKYHDNGVGTEGVRAMQIIGGAFGYGISRNLCQLLAFVIRSYTPGSKIYLFGFSRGAFTIRVLADILCVFGIPDRFRLHPQKDQQRTPKPEDIEIAASEMLRAYKDYKDQLPEIDPGMEAIQYDDSMPECVVDFRKRFHCHVNNSERKKDEDGSQPSKHIVHFMGCWDTVEALGLPFERMKRAAINYFPLKFRNTKPSPKIKTICHALALDDERRAFHPLCFTDVGSPDQKIYQTWFPGNHCHVGGGYSRDEMAMVPLLWMIQHAKNHGLEVNEGQLCEYRELAYSHGQMPSARAGMNFFYGYSPRRIDRFQPQGPWAIHVSTLERLGKQIQSYLPTALMVVPDPQLEPPDPSNPEHQRRFGREPLFFVQKKDGTPLDQSMPVMFVDGGGKNLDLESEDKLWIHTHFSHSDVAAYSKAMDQINNGVVWQGKLLWYACLTFVLAAVFFGWSNSQSELQSYAEVSAIAGAIFGIEKFCLESATSVLPASLNRYVIQGYLNLPGAASLWSIAGIALLIACRRNRRLVEQESLKAWAKTPAYVLGAHRDNDESPKVDFGFRWNFRWLIVVVSTYMVMPFDALLRFTAFYVAPRLQLVMRWLLNDRRTYAVPDQFEVNTERGSNSFFARVLFGGRRRSVVSAIIGCTAATILLIVLCDFYWRYDHNVKLGLAKAKRLAVGEFVVREDKQAKEDESNVTAGMEQADVTEPDGQDSFSKPKGNSNQAFDIGSIAFSTDVLVEQGAKYRVELTPVSEKWEDSDIKSTPAGWEALPSPEGLWEWFKRPFLIAAIKVRREPQHEMFQVLGRIEPGGKQVYGLEEMKKGFTADTNGVLMLFVNDVKGMYFNNEGRAKVKVARVSVE